MNEFELIRRYFTRQPVSRTDVVVGIGDDAAVLDVPPDRQLVVSTDMLVAGVHFPLDTDPAAIGHKALAVNLSDVAAMGAAPTWFTLNLSLPAGDPAWLNGFSAGMFALARKHEVQLVGGDTARGPLTIGIQINGLVPRGGALRRVGARPGDRVYVTGALGDAGLGLLAKTGRIELSEADRTRALSRLDWPEARVREGAALRGLASACIDISDGLLADLGHILEASAVGARIELARVPVSPGYAAVFGQVGWDMALAHGDDYELCFTVPDGRRAEVERLAARWACGVREIGVIEEEKGLRLIDERGASYRPRSGGFDHFARREPEA